MATRTIQTTYYHNKRVVKNTNSATAYNAVPNCIRHMQVNEYQATLAEVYDTENGVLHAVITRSVKGTITIVFKREVQKDIRN